MKIYFHVHGETFDFSIVFKDFSLTFTCFLAIVTTACMAACRYDLSDVLNTVRKYPKLCGEIVIKHIRGPEFTPIALFCK